MSASALNSALDTDLSPQLGDGEHLVFTAAEVAGMFPRELGMTEHWVNTMARKHKIGTIIRRKRVYTRAQVERLVELQAVDAQQAKPARTANTTKTRASKPKPAPLPPASTATTLRARPERARSYGGTA
ncbi:hypothetical protein [Nonomuraea sp. NPDC001023]|uniref:hypothetical protein n=1 Tax=unclassified Nonomuraea TaxID=2593643 RepID=UPI00331C9302